MRNLPKVILCTPPNALYFIATIAMIGVAQGAMPQSAETDERNSVVLKHSPWGDYWKFAPRAPKHILVIAHGTIGENETAADAT